MNLRSTLRFMFLLLSAGVLGLTAAGGCSGAGNCDTFAADYCARIAECDPATYAFISGGDDGICQARIKPSCTQSLLVDGAAQTADKAGECGKNIRSASCDDVLTGHLPDICNPPGMRADGASCSDGLQCQSTRCTGSSTMCGTCMARQQLGGACQSSGDCAAGLRCSFAGTGGGTCANYLALGATCTTADACLPSLFCNRSGSASGTCAARLDVGATCSQSTDCDVQKKLTCDPASKKCAAFSVNYIAGGSSCTPSMTTSYNICKSDAHCQGSITTSGATYTCINAVAAGQACDNTNSNCSAGLVCTNNVCGAPAAPLACK